MCNFTRLTWPPLRYLCCLRIKIHTTFIQISQICPYSSYVSYSFHFSVHITLNYGPLPSPLTFLEQLSTRGEQGPPCLPIESMESNKSFVQPLSLLRQDTNSWFTTIQATILDSV
jgi:hypothetical protein